jgi:SWI/SNF-related matrix-associated actin-dependent regulator of chromatin subfamily A member 5
LPEDDRSESERLADQEIEQQTIDDAEPLTEKEKELKLEMQSQGFGHWNRRDFQQFVNGSARYGRKNYDGIAVEVDSKEPDEIEEYAKAFWKNYQLIEGWEKHLASIEAGEERLRKTEHQRKMLRKKMQQYRVPLQQLKINYTVSTTNKKVYTEEEDRFLLVMLDRHGLETENLYEKIRDEVRESPLFRFDWFFLSRTPIELGRRCTTLLNTVAREFGDPDEKLTNGHKGRGRDRDDSVEDEEEEEMPAKKKAKNGAVVSTSIHESDGNADFPQNKKVKAVKDERGSKASSPARSRAQSVSSTAPAKGKRGGKKK